MIFYGLIGPFLDVVLTQAGCAAGAAALGENLYKHTIMRNLLQSYLALEWQRPRWRDSGSLRYQGRGMAGAGVAG
jgi:hypothetical protein